MTAVGYNILANVVGRSLSAVLAFAFIPLYLKLLGPEAYGLIGLFATLQMIFLLAEVGLSGAFIREIARLSASNDCAVTMVNLCRTMEVVFLFIGIVVSVLIIFASKVIATHWVNPEEITAAQVHKSIIAMGLIIGIQFPFVLYQGGLIGLQRLGILNSILVLVALLRGLGAIVVLTYIEPSIQLYFEWQLLLSVCQVLIIRAIVWNRMPKTEMKPLFGMRHIYPIARFAGGMAAISISSTILMQADKLVLSKMLPLDQFGFYSLSVTAASVPFLISGPIHSAVYPRFAQFVETNQEAEMARLYHKSCQLLSGLMIPFSLWVVFFSPELMLLWTNSEITTRHTYVLVRVLTVGSMFLGFMVIPYALQLAYAWTKLALTVNVVAILVLLPLMIKLTSMYGALGAAFVWVILNAGYVLITIQLMHRRILIREKWRWYVMDVGVPLLVVMAVLACARLVLNVSTTRIGLLASLILILVTAVIASALSMPETRKILLRAIK